MSRITNKTRFTAAFAALSFGLFLLAETSASCAGCGTEVLSNISKAFRAFDEQCRKHLGGAGGRLECFEPNIYNKVVPVMKALGKDSRFGPGDRILSLSETQMGSLVPGEERSFKTPGPVDKNSVTVNFNMLDGGSPVLVKICSISDDGSTISVGTISFAEKEKAGEKSVVVNGVRGKIVQVHLAATRGTKRLGYKLAIS